MSAPQIETQACACEPATVAQHEAGHVVFAVIAGLEIDFGSLNPKFCAGSDAMFNRDGETLGLVNLCDFHGADRLKLLTQLLAGAVAESRHTGVDWRHILDRGNGIGDFRQAKTVAAQWLEQRGRRNTTKEWINIVEACAYTLDGLMSEPIVSSAIDDAAEALTMFSFLPIVPGQVLEHIVQDTGVANRWPWRELQARILDNWESNLGLTEDGPRVLITPAPSCDHLEAAE